MSKKPPSSFSFRDPLNAGEVIEIRGDGKAGSGLLMAMQMFGVALGRKKSIYVQEWPQFSSARKGANVRSFMRVANHPIHSSAAVVRPQVAILLDETASEEIDFASGMREGIYLVNTSKSAKETAEKYQLSGVTITFDGNQLGQKHLGKPMGNISLLAALIHISGGILSDQDGRDSLLDMMKKRRLPDPIQKSNLACYVESLDHMDVAEVKGEASWTHDTKSFEGFDFIPIGAQSELRTSLQNRTARYRPSGFILTFEDPKDQCSGCALCLTNCPENIIAFVPDERRGLRVTGANVVDFCKLCQECVQICPVNLFGVQEEKVA